MKKVTILISLCLVLITGVIVFLIFKGSALRSAGVIKPTPYESDNKLLAKSVALRLFPEFQSNKNTIWIVSEKLESSSLTIVRAILDYYKSLNIPDTTHLKIFNSEIFNSSNEIENIEPRWWFFTSKNIDQVDILNKSFKVEPNVIYISEFNRNDEVPQYCESEKQLSADCLRLVSVREVKKKFKSQNPYFFMRRYNDHQFYLFIETK